MNAIAKFIILYLNEKHNAKMSYKEQDNFIDGIRDILENIENQIKDLKELPHQDRYEI